jgi:hypothetical protein
MVKCKIDMGIYWDSNTVDRPIEHGSLYISLCSWSTAYKKLWEDEVDGEDVLRVKTIYIILFF